MIRTDCSPGMFRCTFRSDALPAHVSRFLAAALGLALLQGCTVGPTYERPEVRLPDAWHQELVKGLAEGEANLETWWTTLDDPVLKKLIERAGRGNLDLKVVLARIREARARLGIATGEYFPDLDAAGIYQRGRASEDMVPVIPAPLERTDNFNQYGFDATWELDFFGRIRRSVESADAGVQASVEVYRDTLVVLYAEVALNYVEARSLQGRLRLAEANVEAQRATLKLTKDRLAAELVPKLDVRQAELNVASTESTIPILKTLLTQAINRLGVLLGEHPEALHEELGKAAPIPKPPANIAVGLPANLLRQRPDIRRAERELAAQTARIGVATADLYPRFSLSGFFAWEAAQFERTFNADNMTFGVGPSFRWNLFDGGRVRSRIAVEDALTEQALHRYEQTVLLALEDVENAMVAYAQERDRRGALARSVAAAQESVKLVETLYRNGLTDFQNVLDMQRALFRQQDLLAESEGSVTRNLIRLYKALGGGWAPRTQPPPTAEEETESDAAVRDENKPNKTKGR